MDIYTSCMISIGKHSHPNPFLLGPTPYRTLEEAYKPIWAQVCQHLLTTTWHLTLHEDIQMGVLFEEDIKTDLTNITKKDLKALLTPECLQDDFTFVQAVMEWLRDHMEQSANDLDIAFTYSINHHSLT